MKRWALLGIIILALMEFVSWRAYKSTKEPQATPETQRQEVALTLQESISREEIRRGKPEREADQSSFTDTEKDIPSETPPKSMGSSSADSESFPPPSTEVVNGRTERTIHMGVRQYEWDPSTIRAKKGELVRLVIHNADVKHGLVIPDLGVDQDIPPDGAVVEFMASKVGTFEFFCSVWCGEGHMEMRGKIIIE